MSDDTQKRIADLERQLTPLLLWESLRWGDKTENGKKGCDIVREILRLQGREVTDEKGGGNG